MEREEERHMQQQINTLAQKVAALTALQSANHDENRKDIHHLQNTQKALLEAITTGLDKIADKFGSRVAAVESDVIDLRIKWSRATGYAIGISAASAAIFQIVKAALSHLGVH